MKTTSAIWSTMVLALICVNLEFTKAVTVQSNTGKNSQTGNDSLKQQNDREPSTTSANPIVDQSNLVQPGLKPGWIAMSWTISQTFKPSMPVLTGVDIDILTANPSLGPANITVEILNKNTNQLLVTASRNVLVGTTGLLHFNFDKGVPVNVGDTYVLHVPGSKDTFGWKYSGDTYPNGFRTITNRRGSTPKPNQDCLFQTYGSPLPFSGLDVSPIVIVPEPSEAELMAIVVQALERSDVQTVERLGPAAFDLLTAVVADPSSDVRPNALLFLGRLYAPKAFELLVDLLKDPDCLVRSYAAMFLGILDDQRAVDPLVAALSDPRYNVRNMAALSLEKLKWQPQTDIQQAAYLVAQLKFQEAAKLGAISVTPLLTVIKDPVSSMRREAAEALAKISWQPETDLERAYYYVALQDWPKVSKLGAITVKPLLMDNSGSAAIHEAKQNPLFGQALSSLGSHALSARVAEYERWRSELTKAQNTNRYRFLLETLKSLGPQAVSELIEEIQQPQSELRITAARMLTRIPADKRAVGPLLAALSEPDPQMRAVVVSALGHQGDTRAVEPLILTLNDPVSQVRAAAASALGQLKDTRAVETLILALEDSDSWVRRNSAQALGNLGDPRAIAPLTEILKDPESIVQEAVSLALSRLSSSGSSENLAARILDKDPRTRILAAEALARTGDVRGIEAAIEAMDHPDVEVRRVATGIFGTQRDPRAVAPLILRLQDEDWFVRGRAASGLGRQGDARAVEPLIAALQDDSEWVRSQVASALVSLGDRRAIEPLKASLKNTRGRTNSSVAVALAHFLNDSTAIEPLIDALRNPDDEYAGLNVLGALMSIGEPVKESLFTLLKDSDPRVRVVAVAALRSMPDTDIVEPLIGILQDTEPSVVRSAASTLVLLDDPRAVKPLAELIEDPNSPLLKPERPLIKSRIEPKIVSSQDLNDSEPLMKFLRNSANPQLQAISAWLLGRLGDRQVVNSLWSQLESSSSNKREISLALVRLGDPRGIPPLLEALKQTATAYENTSTVVSAPMPPYLLRSQDWSEAKVLDALVDIGLPAFEPLLKTLSDDNARMRVLAVRGLGRLGDQRALGPVTAALEDRDERVRKAATEALRQLNEKSSSQTGLEN